MTRPRTKTPGTNRSTQKNARRCPLLKLPAELRNKIYRLALTTEGRVYVDKDTFNIRKALVDTCTQTREETREIFYAENDFTIVMDGFTVWRAVMWLVSLGRTGRMINGLDIAAELSRDGLEKARKRDDMASGGTAALEAAFTTTPGKDFRRPLFGDDLILSHCDYAVLSWTWPSLPPRRTAELLQWDDDVVIMKEGLGLAFEAGLRPEIVKSLLRREERRLGADYPPMNNFRDDWHDPFDGMVSGQGVWESRNEGASMWKSGWVK